MSEGARPPPPGSLPAGPAIAGRRAMLLVPLLLAGLSMLGPFSIDTPFPAFKDMGADLPATTEQMQLVVSAYLLAFGLMSPFHGPLSDAVGRRPVIIAGVCVYAVASVGCAVSTSLPMRSSSASCRGSAPAAASSSAAPSSATCSTDPRPSG